MPLKWVFIDLDDTLWDFSANSLDTLRELYTEYVYLSEIFNSFDNFSDVYHEINDRMWMLFQRGVIDSDTVKRRRFELLLEPVLGSSEAVKRAAILQHEYLWRLGNKTRIVEGAIDLLRWLSKRYLIGVLSNGFREVQYRKLYGGELWRYVQRMIISDEVGVSKPDARVFRYAEQATGATAETTLMIGDNAEADIRGAVAAGWKAIYFDRKSKGNAPQGVSVITSLSEIPRLLS